MTCNEASAVQLLSPGVLSMSIVVEDEHGACFDQSRIAPELCKTEREATQDASRLVGYMLSIITCPKPEQLTWVAPSIKRAKS